MRWILGKMPSTPDFHPEAEGWLPMREPEQNVFLALAYLLAIPLGIFWGMLWMLLNGQREMLLTVSPGTAGLSQVLIGLAIVLGYFLLHELLHALAMPGGWRSADTLIGFGLNFFYAYTTRPMSKRRFLLVFATPMLVLTLLPILIDALLPGWNMPPGLLLLIVLHGMGCSGDVLGLLLAARLPRGAIVRNQGWKTWYHVQSMPLSPSPETGP